MAVKPMKIKVLRGFKTKWLIAKKEKRIMVVFHDICQNHLHIQHQAPKSLNINTKLVVVEVAPPHFRPTPKTSRRFKKTRPRFVANAVVFFIKTVAFHELQIYSIIGINLQL